MTTGARVGYRLALIPRCRRWHHGVRRKRLHPRPGPNFGTLGVHSIGRCSTLSVTDTVAWRLRCETQLWQGYKSMQRQHTNMVHNLKLISCTALDFSSTCLISFSVVSSNSSQSSCFACRSRISGMGQFISRLLSSVSWGNQKLAILMLGLDNAGKTTLLYKLKLGDRVDTIPTIGFNVEAIQYRNVDFTVWDVGGQDKIRPLWKHYFNNIQGLIFVVDSNDTNRIAEARDELQKLLSEPELERVKVLVFANKQDLPHAINVAEVTDKLGLATMRGRQWFVQGCTSTTGEGLHEGLDWLATALRDV